MTAASIHNQPIKTTKRVVPGILLGLFLAGLNYGIYWVMMVSTGMMTGSCSETFFNFWHWMIELAWPALLFLSAAAPAWLVFSGKRWRWFFMSLAVGAILNVAWLLAWFLGGLVVGC